VIGLVAVGRDYPTFLQSLRSATPNLLTYLGIASLLGVAGSLLVARRVKRQTLGLEPREITGLVEHRDAMLFGIKEGVVGLDQQHRVTLVNDEARQLLGLPEHAVGRTLEELGIDQRLYDVLSGRAEGQDQIVLLGDRVLTLNRMPIATRGRSIGSVTTLRDRTELVTLQRELDVTKHTTDTLRAQAHEFSNRLHTISGLIELGEYGQVAHYVTRVSADHARTSDQVTSLVADPALAASLIAKGSLAAEQGVTLRLSPCSRVERLPDELSADLVTVVGNLVNNALDAIGPALDGWVEVEVVQEPGQVAVVVRDSGPGVAPEIVDEVFRHGFSTKGGAKGITGTQRGLGLALTRLICTRRGGDVRVRNEQGAVFTATLPVRSGVPQ
jgi:two-component system, CitB family, sensor kinase